MVTLEDLCELVNTIYKKEVLPSTKYKIYQTVGVDMEKVNMYMYCSQCQKTLREIDSEDEIEVTCVCGFVNNSKKSPFFVSLDFCEQLKNLIETSHMNKNFLYQKERVKENANGIEDIIDGKGYRELQQEGYPLHCKDNYSYTFNSDGCRSAISSNISVWPTYAYVNEIELGVRFKNILLLALWVDDKEPDMNTYLLPFVEKANFLSTKGLEWEEKVDNSIVNKRQHHSLIIPTVCCVDSMARCKILNMKRPNAEQGCTFCHHRTE